MRGLQRRIAWTTSYLQPMETKWGRATEPQYLPLSQGSQERDWNFIFGVTNFLLVSFLQPVIISNVSMGLHRYLKTLTWVLYNFPIFPAPSVVNCIGRWIFWHLRLSGRRHGRLYALVHPRWKWILEGWKDIRVVGRALPLQRVFGHFYSVCDCKYLTILLMV